MALDSESSHVPLHNNNMKNNERNSTAASVGVLGIAAVIGAPAFSIAAGCSYLAWKLLESKEDPNTIGYIQVPDPTRKNQPKA